MKKIIGFVLVLSMLLGMSCAFAFNSGAYLLGDVNADGKINAADNLMINTFIVEGGASAFASSMGDINSDNKVNASDSNLVIQLILGMISAPKSYVVGTVSIDGVDLSNFVIVCPEGADPCMKYAAETLKSHIGDACGFYPDIVSDANGGHAITLLKDTTMDGEEAGVLENEAYHMYSVDNGIVIEGGRYSGCMYGAYDLLKKYFGYRFYYKPDQSIMSYDDQAFRYVYSADKIEIANVDDTHYPAILARNTYGTLRRTSPALAYNGEVYFNNAKYGNYGMINKACHGISRWVSEAEMNEYEWGEKYGKQPCYTDKNIINTTKERILNYLDQQVRSGAIPGKTLNDVDVAQLDTSTFCICRTCLKNLREDVYHSGNMVRFANIMSEAIQAVPAYKDKIYVDILVYTDTIIPPAVTRPDKMVALSYCFYVGLRDFVCTAHSLGDPDCPYNIQYSQYFDEWASYGCRMYVWYYPMESYFTGGSVLYLFNAYYDIKYFHDKNVYGVFTCGEDRPTDSSLICYTLMQQLMWDCDMTYDEYLELMKEDIRLMYGDGYEYIYEYLTIMDTAQKTAIGTNGLGDACGFHASPMKKLNMTYIKDNADRILECYNKAMELSTSAQKKDVDKFFLHARFWVAGATHTSRWLNGTEEDRAWYKSNIDYFLKNSKKYGVFVVTDMTGFQPFYFDPKATYNYDENPFEWMIEAFTPGERYFGGWDSDYNY